MRQHQLDMDTCYTWSVESIQELLTASVADGGVGLSQNRAKDANDTEGSDLEITVAALIGFNGDDEDKIGHAFEKLRLKDDRTAEAITRWLFSTLLTKD